MDADRTAHPKSEWPHTPTCHLHSRFERVESFSYLSFRPSERRGPSPCHSDRASGAVPHPVIPTERAERASGGIWGAVLGSALPQTTPQACPERAKRVEWIFDSASGLPRNDSFCGLISREGGRELRIEVSEVFRHPDRCRCSLALKTDADPAAVSESDPAD